MPVSFILAIICGIAGLLGLAVAVTAGSRDTQSMAKAVAGAGLGLAVVSILFSSAYTVPTRNVGIVTSWNKPTGEVTGPGLQWVAPWQKVDDWDASRQSFDRRGEHCVQVRIAGLQNACVDVLVEWTTDPAKAPEQWASYKREFDNFVAKRVDPNITGAVNDTFADHDPLANVDEATGQVMAPQTGPLVDEVRSSIKARIGGDVEVQSVVIGFIRYDDKTQQSIEAFQQKVLAAKNLEQDRRNAEIQKQVSETNAAVDPVVRCLEIADKHGREPGFCLGGGNPVQTPVQ